MAPWLSRAFWPFLQGEMLLVDDDVWLPGRPLSSGQARRLGPLAAFVDAALHSVNPRHLPGDLEGLHAICQLDFVLCELLPCLRDLGMRRSPAVPPQVAANTQAHELATQAGRLLSALDTRLDARISPASLRTVFHLPAAVLAGRLVPMERLPDTEQTPAQVTLRGVRYALRHGDARSMVEVFADLERVAQDEAARAIDPEHLRQIHTLRDAFDRVLDVKTIQHRPRSRVLYSDRTHQVHFARGHFLLVRGPVAMRVGPPSQIWLGIPVTGTSRAELLSVPPRVGKTPDAFWSDGEDPCSRGICPGPKDQYKGLLDTRIANAEALVQWLDDGVIIATGRSDYHRKVRMARRGVQVMRPRPPRPLSLVGP